MAKVTLESSYRGLPLRRLVLALGVLALLLSDVWRVPHLLMVRHQVCGEHGELVHEHDREAGAAAGTRPLELARTVMPGVPEGHHHDHCGIVATGGKSAAVAVVSSGAQLAAAAPSSAVLSFRVASRPDSGRVLAYAPKQSPPA